MIPRRGSPNRSAAVLGVCGLAVFTDVVGVGVVVPAIPQLAALFGASDSTMAYAWAAFSVAFLVSALPLGYVVDRTGRAGLVIVFGMVSLAAAAFGLGVARVVWVFVLAQAFYGVGSAAAWVAGQPLVARVVGEAERGGVWMSSLTLAMGAGMVVGPLIGSLGGFRTPFVIYLVIAASATVLSFVMLRGERIHHGAAGMHYARVARRPRLLAACLVIAVVYSGVGMMEVLFPLYMDSLGYAKSGIGLLLFLFALSVTAVQPLVGRRIDRAGPDLPVAVALVTMGAMLTLMVVGTSFAAWSPVFLLYGAGVGAAVSACMIMVALVSRPEERGSAYGLWNFAFSIGYLVGPVVGGALSAATNGMGPYSGLRAPFVFFSVVLVVSLIPVRVLAGRGGPPDRT